MQLATTPTLLKATTVKWFTQFHIPSHTKYTHITASKNIQLGTKKGAIKFSDADT